MSANVETMFSVRETPWHGLGRIVRLVNLSGQSLSWSMDVVLIVVVLLKRQRKKLTSLICKNMQIV